MLDLYDRMWDGKPLGDNEYVISADEKTSIQARCRCHPTLPPGVARTMRATTTTTAAARWPTWPGYDVLRAQVFGRCEQSTGIEPFHRLVAQGHGTPTLRIRRRVFWIVDNGSSHRAQAAIDRLTQSSPTRSWRRYTSPYSDVVRARIVLYAAEGLGNDEIAARLDPPRQVVSQWRKRFHEQRLPGLAAYPPAHPALPSISPAPQQLPHRTWVRAEPGHDDPRG